MPLVNRKFYNCWFCDNWIKDKQFMDHLRMHDREDHWMSFNPGITFPTSLEECERRFVPVGLLNVKEMMVEEEDEIRVLYG